MFVNDGGIEFQHVGRVRGAVCDAESLRERRLAYGCCLSLQRRHPGRNRRTRSVTRHRRESRDAGKCGTARLSVEWRAACFDKAAGFTRATQEKPCRIRSRWNGRVVSM